MTPDIQSCLVCDDVRQERNGKFMLIGIFDTIHAVQFPLLFPRVCLVTRWCNGTGEFKQTSRIVKPDQKSIAAIGQEIPVKLQGIESICTNIELYLNMVFQSEGVYWVEVLLDGDLAIRFPLRVAAVQPQKPRP